MDTFPVSGEVVWDLARLEPTLFEALLARRPALADLQDDLRAGFLAQTLPLPGSWAPYQRPGGHWRAYYRCQPELGCLAFKGTESYATGFDEMLDVMVSQYARLDFSLSRPDRGPQPQPGRVLMSVLERFLFVENKFPGVVLLQEALAEAERARAVQRAHLRRYGQLARVPVAWLVHRVDPRVTESVVNRVCARLPVLHHATVRALAAPGFGVLVYWVPNLPLRVAHISLPPVGPDCSLSQRIAALSLPHHPRGVVESWVNLLSRLLCLGFVAADPLGSLRGACIEAQNLTLDGGMVDLDSVRPMQSFRSNAEVLFAIERGFEMLTQSISLYLFGEIGQAGSLRSEVLYACQREREAGALLPEALARLLEATSTYDSMMLSRSALCQLAGYPD